jgi:hypothetical protein
VRRALILLAVVALAGCATAKADTGRVAAAGGGLTAAPPSNGTWANPPWIWSSNSSWRCTRSHRNSWPPHQPDDAVLGRRRLDGWTVDATRVGA